MKIKILFVAEIDPDPISSTIMRVQGTNYSHAMIIFIDEIGDERIFHAVGTGVESPMVGDFFDTHIAVHTFELELMRSADYFYGYVRGSNGKGYSKAQVLSLAIDRESDNDDAEMICSETVGQVMVEMGGVFMENDQDVWKPIDCKNALIAHGCKEIEQ